VLNERPAAMGQTIKTMVRRSGPSENRVRAMDCVRARATRPRTL